MDGFEKKSRYLEFIQNIISRMAECSFKCKEFMVLICSALIAAFASAKNGWLLLVCVFPILVFWFLDAYYLYQEKLFRDLYNRKAVLPDLSSEFDNFQITPQKNIKLYFSKVFSKTILPLYLTLLTASVIGGILFLVYAKGQ